MAARAQTASLALSAAFAVTKFATGVLIWYVAGHKDPLELRTVDLHKTGLETKKLIVQQALNTEDMDQEQFLSKIRQRFDRYAAGQPNGAAAGQDPAPAHLY